MLEKKKNLKMDVPNLSTNSVVAIVNDAEVGLKLFLRYYGRILYEGLERIINLLLLLYCH